MFEKQKPLGSERSYGFEVPIDPDDPEARKVAERFVCKLNNLAGVAASNDGALYDGVLRVSYFLPPMGKGRTG